VQAVYDVEATKTVGLAQRLLSERDRPQADVFWNGEFVQTMVLKEEGVLAPFQVADEAGLPPEYVDPEGYWAAIGGRARVIIVNTDLVAADDAPNSIYDLLSEAHDSRRIALANPLFGTTLTQAAALYADSGADVARTFYSDVVARGVQVVDGNSVVRDQVAGGQLAWGLTDTDDACGAILKGQPVDVIFPDQAPGQMGTLVIPNTVAQVAGGPNPAEAQALIDFLLSPEGEALMVELDWIQIPVHVMPEDVAPSCFAGEEVRGMRVGFEEIYDHLSAAQDDLHDLFVR